MRKGDLVEVAVRCSRHNQWVYERGEVGVLVTEIPDHVVGGLFVVHVMIDEKIAKFVNIHIRPLQAAEEGKITKGQYECTKILSVKSRR